MESLFLVQKFNFILFQPNVHQPAVAKLICNLPNVLDDATEKDLSDLVSEMEMMKMIGSGILEGPLKGGSDKGK